MAVYIGQFLLTAELLNKVAAPLIKERYRFLQAITFRIVDDFVMAEISGRYSLLGFKGFITVHLLEFVFGRAAYRIELSFSLELSPRFLKPLVVGLLKKKLSDRPGVSRVASRLRLDLDKMPFFKQFQEGTGGGAFFSLLEITWDKQDSRGLLVNLYLHEPRYNDPRRNSGDG